MLGPLWARLWASEEALDLCTTFQTIHLRTNTNNVPNFISSRSFSMNLQKFFKKEGIKTVVI